METTMETFSKRTETNVRDLVLSSAKKPCTTRSYPNTCCCELPGCVTSSPNKNHKYIYTSHVSKWAERAVFEQIYGHILQNQIYPVLKSSYREGHSTETALLKVLNDIMLGMDSKCVTLLVLLDLSAAFDTVSHEILINRLQNKVGLQGAVRNWLESYV